jgi:WD40 repeat protein
VSSIKAVTVEIEKFLRSKEPQVLCITEAVPPLKPRVINMDDEQTDVFLCHNSQEKEAVRVINEALRQQYGLKTYLDEATLVPGAAWERAIQGALARSKSCAVIVGPCGWGKYQLDNEVRPAVRRRGTDPSFLVIPVLLPGANVQALTEFSDFFSQTHWVTFDNSPGEAAAIQTLTDALRGENAFPEGPPRLTASRVLFDAIRWDTGSRRDNSLLYTGKLLREARRFFSNHPPSLVVDSRVVDFLSASLLHHNHDLARQMAAHASVMWVNPRRRDLAARLALESVRRLPTAEGIGVVRQAFGALYKSVGTLHHPAPVTAAARNHESGGLATGCKDGSVCVWDESTLRVVGKHADGVRAVADLGSGKFVTAAADGSCIVWDWRSGERVRAFQAGQTVETLDVRRNGDRTVLMTCGGFPGQPGEVAVWNADDGTEVWRMGMVTHAVLDANGTHGALAWGNHVALCGIADGKLAAKQALDATVIGVATHPTAAWVAATTFDRRAYLTLFRSDPPELRELGTGISRVSPIRISPDGRYVAAIRDDFTISMWDLADWSRRLFKFEGLLSVDIQFSDHSRYLAAISPEATAVVVWRIDDGEHVCTIEQDAPSLAVFDDGRNGLWVASNGTDATFIEMPRQSESFATASPGIATALAYGPDGTLAWCGLTVSADLKVGDAALWAANPLTGRARIDAPLSEVGRIAFDSQGRYVAVVGSQSVRVWDLATGQEAAPPESPFWIEHDVSEELPAVANFLAAPSVAKARAQRGYVRTLVSSNGRFIAIDHGKQVVSLWNAPAAAEIVVFSTVAALTCKTFNADGTLFATGDARGGVMLWQTDGTSLGHMKHDEPIAQLAFSPDGDFLAIASMDSMLRVWIVSPSLLAAKVGEKVSGSLTDEEWARYLGDEPRGE